VSKILIAEDDTAVREFVSRALVNAGHDVTAAADGVQALEALEKIRSNFFCPTSLCPNWTVSRLR